MGDGDWVDAVFSIIVFIIVIIFNISVVCGLIWFAVWLASIYF